jgi:hypothetical protein
MALLPNEIRKIAWNQIQKYGSAEFRRISTMQFTVSTTGVDKLGPHIGTSQVIRSRYRSIDLTLFILVLTISLSASEHEVSNILPANLTH